MLTDLTVKSFIDKVAGSDPVPGGGSISALNGALATALSAMVANLTVGRKKYMEVSEEMEAVSAKLTAVTKKLIEDVDLDSDAYNRVFAAFKMPKETDEEKALRSQAIQKETKYAAEVPMDVAKSVFAILPLIETVAMKGNSNAVTDACVSMMCARTAILGALMNVRINLSSIKDEAFVAAMEKDADEMEKETVEREHNLYNHVKTVL